MGCTSRFDKRAIFAVLLLVLVACKDKGAEAAAVAAADDEACARQDLDACKRRSARLLAECDATKNGWPCVRAGDTVAAYEGPRAAVVHYERSCELGTTLGCGRAAAVYAVMNDRAKAQTYFEKGCKLKDPFACEELGRCLLGGTPQQPTLCDRDLDKAKALFLRACELKALTLADCENAQNVDRLKKKSDEKKSD